MQKNRKMCIPGASYSVAYGINATTVVGGYMDSTGSHAFMATPVP